MRYKWLVMSPPRSDYTDLPHVYEHDEVLACSSFQRLSSHHEQNIRTLQILTQFSLSLSI